LNGTAVTLTITNPTDLAYFVGNSDLGFEIGSYTTQTAGGTGGNDTITFSNKDGADIGVQYDGTNPGPPVVPEPGTLSLFGTGLLGLAGMLRNKFAR
jgi:hypothetical protein